MIFNLVKLCCSKCSAATELLVSQSVGRNFQSDYSATNQKRSQDRVARWMALGDLSRAESAQSLCARRLGASSFGAGKTPSFSLRVIGKEGELFRACESVFFQRHLYFGQVGREAFLEKSTSSHIVSKCVQAKVRQLEDIKLS